MGGAAYVIYGEYTHINSEKSGFFSRIFSRKNKIKNIEKLISKELNCTINYYLEANMTELLFESS